MTREELKAFSFKLIDTLISKQCYIKGYGKQYRVCDGTHSPVINISKQQFDVLYLNRIIEPADLIWVVAVLANPFKNGQDIKLPTKEYSNEIS